MFVFYTRKREFSEDLTIYMIDEFKEIA